MFPKAADNPFRGCWGKLKKYISTREEEAEEQQQQQIVGIRGDDVDSDYDDDNPKNDDTSLLHPLTSSWRTVQKNKKEEKRKSGREQTNTETLVLNDGV